MSSSNPTGQGLGISRRQGIESSSKSNSSPQRPPRRPSATTRPELARQGTSDYSSFSDLTPPSDSSLKPRQSSAYRPGMERKEPLTSGPSRSSSIASTSTRSSVLRKARSADLLRRLTKADPIAGARYIPLAEADSEDPGSIIGAAVMSATSSQSSAQRSDLEPKYLPERSGTVMTQSSASSAGSTSRVLRPLPSQPSHAGSHMTAGQFQRLSKKTSLSSTDTQPMSRPQPPRAESALSGHNSHPFNPEAVARSNSNQPTYPPPVRPMFSVPEGLFDPPGVRNSMDNRRLSGLTTGIHSKNAVLLSAENGSIMLEYSPNGDGVWKEGQRIGQKQQEMADSPEAMSAELPLDLDEGEERPQSRLRQNSQLSEEIGERSQPGRRGHLRSHSEGDAMLARQGTLLHPLSSKDRKSAELGVMLGNKRRKASGSKVLPAPDAMIWQDEGPVNSNVRIEASKKRKARVEVDVVLERDSVVEGGEVRGRMEVRVNSGKKAEGLRVGGGKIRVVGFEEISSSYRHIFYHHPHPLPQFSHPPQPDAPRTTLFASQSDHEGYRLASEGSHSIPFRLRLPMNGGAKGSFGTANSKGPSIRYVVVGSVKLHLPSTGKRSIAHFYRSITVLPYLKASIVLAPSTEPVAARVESGLGWSLNGQKGKVDLRVALGRRTWVCGQKMWCEVEIYNDSSKRIKSLQLALLQTVQTFNPQPMLDPSGRSRPIFDKRKSTEREALLDSMDEADMDLDACQTDTQRRKVSEETFESDFASSGAGRVTGKGWWTGVEPGEFGRWDLSLTLPNDLVSIRRTRLVEVTYNLRVTVSGSIFVDVPINLIDFLSIDPPPMPGDGGGLSVAQSVSSSVGARSNILGIQGAQPYRQQNQVSVQGSVEGMEAAQESSTTLHLDQLMLSRPTEPDAQPSSTSPVSLYEEADGPAMTHARPAPNRLMSYMSSVGDCTEESVGMSSADLEHADEFEKAMLAAKRARGRAKSLQKLTRAETRKALEGMEEEEEPEEFLEDELASLNLDRGSLVDSPDDLEGDHSDGAAFRPLDTPSEEVYKMVDDTSGSSAGEKTPRPPGSGEPSQIPHLEALASRRQSRVEFDNGPGLRDLFTAAIGRVQPHPEAADLVGDDSMDIGNDTILDDLVAGRNGEELLEDDEDEEWEDASEASIDLGKPLVDSSAKDQHEVSASAKKARQTLAPPRIAGGGSDTDSQLAYMTGKMVPSRDRYLNDTRSFNGSVSSAITTTTSAESELGQIHEAIKTDLSLKSPVQTLDPTVLGSHLPRGKTPLPADIYDGLDDTVTMANVGKTDREEKKDGVQDGQSTPRPKSAAGRPAVATPSRIPIRSKTSQGQIKKKASMPKEISTRGTSVRETASKSRVKQSAVEGEPASSTPSVEDVPGLTPSIESDGSSSDEHQLESPHFTDVGSNAPSRARRQSTSAAAGVDFAGVESSPENLWMPASSLLGTNARAKAGRRKSAADLSSAHSAAASSDDHSSHSHGSGSTGQSGSTNHSLLPSVKSKIAQLEERQDALRRMSLASFGTQSNVNTPVMGRASPMPPAKSSLSQAIKSSAPNTPTRLSRTPGPAGSEAMVSPLAISRPATVAPGLMSRPPTASPAQAMSPPGRNPKRKSYTTALAPRPTRTISDDTGAQIYPDEMYHRPSLVTSSDHGHGSPQPRQRRKSVVEYDLGYARRSKDDADPIERAKTSLRRDQSVSSTSTTATTVEAALISRQTRNSSKPMRAQTMYVDGKHGGFGGYEIAPKSNQTLGVGPALPTQYDYSPGQPTSPGYVGYTYGGGASPGGQGGMYGGYTPYKVGYGAETTGHGHVRPADRPNQVYEGAEVIEWEKFM